MAAAADEPVVTTSAGRVSGERKGGVSVFRGVPYAAPPTGAARLRPPAPPSRFEGVRACVDFGAACPQWDFMRLGDEHARYAVSAPKDEDCLTLNVWTPAIDDERRPVFLFLHGGGYFSGAGSVPVYDGTRFARHGAVMVTCNYRLGAFGFLYVDDLFDDLSATGNLGLLDHVRALEWIRENIAGFGGDPENVTVMGSSAGGISTCALMAMPSARPLIRRAVPISCSAGSVRDRDSATRSARQLLDAVGVRPGDLDALLALPADALVVDIGLWARIGGLGPVVDGTVLPVAPVVAVEAGDAAAIDLLIGCTGDEQGGRHSEVRSVEDGLRIGSVPLPRPKPEDGFDLRRLFGADADVSEIRRVYEASLAGAGRPTQDGDIFLAASSDLMMVRPTVRFAELQRPHNANTFLFRFTWPSPGWDGALGSFHGITSPFLFDNLDDPTWADVVGATPPQRLADEFHGALIAFATSGQPGHGELDWPPYDSERRSTMVFDVPSRVIDDPEHERRELIGLDALQRLR